MKDTRETAAIRDTSLVGKVVFVPKELLPYRLTKEELLLLVVA